MKRTTILLALATVSWAGGGLYAQEQQADQEDFTAASSDYARVASQPKETLRHYQTRLKTSQKRVKELQKMITAGEAELVELDELETERYLMLKARFEGKQLEKRVAEEAAQIDLQRRRLRDSLKMQRRDLVDAERRARELEVEYQLAKVRVQMSGHGKDGELDTPATDRMEGRAKSVQLIRGLEIGSFPMLPVPVEWLSRSPEEV